MLFSTRSFPGQTPLPFGQVAVLMGVRLAEPSKYYNTVLVEGINVNEMFNVVQYTGKTGRDGLNRMTLNKTSSHLPLYQSDDRGIRRHRQSRSGRLLFRSRGEFCYRGCYRYLLKAASSKESVFALVQFFTVYHWAKLSEYVSPFNSQRRI